MSKDSLPSSIPFKKLEEFRQKVNKSLFNAIGSIVLGVVTFLMMGRIAEISGKSAIVPMAVMFVAFLLGIYGVYCLSVWKKTKKQYANIFKRTVVSGVVGNMHPDWKYQVAGISEYDFKRTEFFPGTDKFESDDCIFGSFEGRKFRSSDIHAQEYRGSGKNRRLVTVFRGLIVSVECDAPVGNKTFILPDQAESSLGSLIGKFLQGANFTRPQLVNMEDPEFEKLFVVYSNDSYEAHRFLTPVKMKKLVSLRHGPKKFHGVSIIDDVAHFAIRFPDDLFEPKTNRPLSKEDMKEVEQIVSYIEKFINFVASDMRKIAQG